MPPTTPLREVQYETRSFAIDVLDCPRCHSRLRILSILHSPTAVRAILDSLDLPARAPPTAPPRPDAQLDPDRSADPFPIDPIDP